MAGNMCSIFQKITDCFRIAYCEEKGLDCPSKDPLDRLLEELKDKIDDKIDTGKMFDNLKDKIDSVSQDVSDNIKEISKDTWKRIEQAVLDSMDDKSRDILHLISSILERLNDFSMPDIEFKVPRLILLAILRKIQEYHQSGKTDNNECIAINMSRNEFEDAKRIGKLMRIL